MIKKILIGFGLIILINLVSEPVKGRADAMLFSDPRGLGPEFQISDTPIATANHYLPAVAYAHDHQEFLVVWHQSISGSPTIRNIFVQRVSLTGGLVGTTIQVSFGNSDAEPAVAYSKFYENFLVVWMHDASGNGSRYEIWGQLVKWNGSLVNASFRIFGFPLSSLWKPRIAYEDDPPHNAFFVIWDAYDTSSGLPKDISGVHVTDAGVPDALAHNIAFDGEVNSTGYVMHAPREADLTFNAATNGNLVTWIGYETWQSNPPTEYDGVFGQFLYNDGKLFREWFCPGCYTSDNQTPAAASGGYTGYLVVLSHQDTPAPYLTVGQTYDRFGNWLGPPFKMGEQLGDQINQAVAGNGAGNFVVARQVDSPSGQQIWAMQCFNRSDSAHCDSSFPVENYSFWDGKNPALADGGQDSTTYLIVYEETAPGDPSVHQRIYGRIYSAHQWAFLPFVKR